MEADIIASLNEMKAGKSGAFELFRSHNNFEWRVRNVTQSNGDCCANSPARAGEITKVASFQDENDLACGLQTINADGL